MKLRAEFTDLINTIGLLTENCGYQILIESLLPFLNKILVYLKHPSPNSHMLKIATCKLLKLLGKHLTEINYRGLETFPSEILSALRNLKTEKLPTVQTAARETLKI